MASLNKTLILIFLILVLIPGGNAISQERPSPGEDPERGEARERIRENIETIRTWKLLEALDLTSEQSAQFLPVLLDFQKAKKSLEGKRRDLLQELEATLPAKHEDMRLKEILAGLDNNQKQFHAEIEKYFEKAKVILTLEQQAKLYLFEEKFERKMRETIEQIRGKHSGWKESER